MILLVKLTQQPISMPWLIHSRLPFDVVHTTLLAHGHSLDFRARAAVYCHSQVRLPELRPSVLILSVHIHQHGIHLSSWCSCYSLRKDPSPTNAHFAVTLTVILVQMKFEDCPAELSSVKFTLLFMNRVGGAHSKLHFGIKQHWFSNLCCI